MAKLGQCTNCGGALAVLSQLVRDAAGKPIDRDAAGKPICAEQTWWVGCGRCGVRAVNHPMQLELDQAAAALKAKKAAQAVGTGPIHYTEASVMETIEANRLVQDARIARLEAEVVELKALLAPHREAPRKLKSVQ